jgi:hypothetical protein
MDTSSASSSAPSTISKSTVYQTPSTLSAIFSSSGDNNANFERQPSLLGAADLIHPGEEKAKSYPSDYDQSNIFFFFSFSTYAYFIKILIFIFVNLKGNLPVEIAIKKFESLNAKTQSPVLSPPSLSNGTTNGTSLHKTSTSTLIGQRSANDSSPPSAKTQANSSTPSQFDFYANQAGQPYYRFVYFCARSMLY